MGESDVKFTRYVHAYGNLLVHAIDGDYMMIALLYYARTATPTATNRIHIYRQLATPLGAEKPDAKRPRVIIVDSAKVRLLPDIKINGGDGHEPRVG